MLMSPIGMLGIRTPFADELSTSQWSDDRAILVDHPPAYHRCSHSSSHHATVVGCVLMPGKQVARLNSPFLVGIDNDQISISTQMECALGGVKSEETGRIRRQQLCQL